MNDTFTLVVKTPEKELFNGDALSVHVTTELGEMELKPKHANILGSIDFTRFQIKVPEGKEFDFLGRTGMVHFSNAENTARILINDCHKEKEISLLTAKDYLELVLEKLKNKESLSDFQVNFMEGERLVLEKQIKSLEE